MVPFPYRVEIVVAWPDAVLDGRIWVRNAKFDSVG